jgi:hypothetical protein
MTPEELKKEANKRLIELDLSVNSNQPAMKSIVVDLGIEIESNKADDLRKILAPIKESLVSETNETVEETAEVVEVEETEETNETVEETAEVVEKVTILKGNFIMTKTHLNWGANGRNHFYAKKKPLINAKVMGKFHGTLKIWLDKGWIEKGSYKK